VHPIAYYGIQSHMDTGSWEDSAQTTGERYEVVVVGGGNAGLCAAHAARECGAEVLVLEKGAPSEAGGNSFYSAGAFRVVHDGLDDPRLGSVIDDQLTRERLPVTDLGPYSAKDFKADMQRLTSGQCDEALTDVLVADSADIVDWLARMGLRWRLMYERQAYVSSGRWKFFGGLAIGTEGGGKGLLSQHTDAASRAGVRVIYQASVCELLQAEGGVCTGVRYQTPDGVAHTVHCQAVVLTAGGFEADPDRRARYLGPEWRHALVRGNPLNTGEVLDLALGAGAASYGDWRSCHSVAWDAGAAPGGGNRELTNQLTRQSYPLGIVVNKLGQRFLDEGADYRNYTYARYGREILNQPESVAFQLFDSKTRPLLRGEEYDSRPITGTQAQSLSALADTLGIRADGLLATVNEFNASIAANPFDPAVKDNRAAAVVPPKSNWAQALDSPPYYGYAVACGITFTFGGLSVDTDARVRDTQGRTLPGLYAAGELVGGLFSGNYPGGSGLTAGAVFGRRAGYSAAIDAQRKTEAETALGRRSSS
jgi:tricarballylate dehydrogenase